MDNISFQLGEIKYDADNKKTAVAYIVINGNNLIEIIKRVETPYAKLNGEENIAGSYAPLPLEDLYEELSFSEEERNTVKEAIILGCPCGCAECWPLYVKIEQSENFVIWHSFSNPYRKWDYSRFGPLVFDRKEYEFELKRLRRMIEIVKDK